MTFAEEINAKAKAYETSTGAAPNHLVLDIEKYALLLFELNTTIYEKKPKTELKEYNGMKVVQVTMFCEGRIRFGFGK